MIEELKFKYTCKTISYRPGLLTNIIPLNIVIAFVQKMNSEKRALVRVHFDAQKVTVKILFWLTNFNNLMKRLKYKEIDAIYLHR